MWLVEAIQTAVRTATHRAGAATAGGAGSPARPVEAVRRRTGRPSHGGGAGSANRPCGPRTAGGDEDTPLDVIAAWEARIVGRRRARYQPTQAAASEPSPKRKNSAR